MGQDGPLKNQRHQRTRYHKRFMIVWPPISTRYADQQRLLGNSLRRSGAAGSGADSKSNLDFLPSLPVAHAVISVLIDAPQVQLAAWRIAGARAHAIDIFLGPVFIPPQMALEVHMHGEDISQLLAKTSLLHPDFGHTERAGTAWPTWIERVAHLQLGHRDPDRLEHAPVTQMIRRLSAELARLCRFRLPLAAKEHRALDAVEWQLLDMAVQAHANGPLRAPEPLSVCGVRQHTTICKAMHGRRRRL